MTGLISDFPAPRVASLRDPALATALGKVVAQLAPGERVSAHAPGCHYLRECAHCTCRPIRLEPLARA